MEELPKKLTKEKTAAPETGPVDVPLPIEIIKDLFGEDCSECHYPDFGW